MNKVPQKTFFRNKIVTKKYLQKILFWSFRTFGIAKAAFLSDSFKKLGFYFATQAGISLNIEDLKVPPLKTSYIKEAYEKIEKAEFEFNSGHITEVEKYQRVIGIWTVTSDKLKTQVIEFFRKCDPLNPIFMMAFSGARGNLSQIRQLVSIRGLMTGPSGNLIDIPITKNFREGLNTTDYMISAYGARKGLVDTALKTADSGYLTRRLIDVAQDILIRQIECNTNQGIYFYKLNNKKGKIFGLKDRILGRILAKDLIHLESKKIIGYKNSEINSLIVKKIEQCKIESVIVRSPLTCESSRSICQNCYGWNLSTDKLVDLGEAVGIIAAQSIGEPGTQLTMRTFHIGGIFSFTSSYQIVSQVSGQIFFSKTLKTIPTRNIEGKNVKIIEFPTNIEIINFKNEVFKIFLKKDTILFVNNKEFIKKNQLIACLPEKFKGLERQEKKLVYSNISGEIISTQKLNNKNKLDKTIQNNLIWVLSGTVFNIPFSAKVIRYKFSYLTKIKSIATTKLIWFKKGRIRIIKTSKYNKIKDSKIKLFKTINNIENCNLFLVNTKSTFSTKNFGKYYLIKLSYNKFYFLKKLFQFNFKQFTKFAQLINSNFRTNLSGIIYFLKLKTSLNNNFQQIKYGGTIFYLPEERFIINSNLSKNSISDLCWLESKTKIYKNLYNKNSGLLKIISSNNLIKKLIIKSGYKIQLSYNQFKKLNFKKQLFFKGENILNIHEIKQLSYVEAFKSLKEYFLIIRPIFLYQIPKIKLRKTDSEIFPITNSFINIYSTHFKHKNKIVINNNKFINLIKTDLFFINKNFNLSTYKKKFNNTLKLKLKKVPTRIEFFRKKNHFCLQLNIFENIFSSKFQLKVNNYTNSTISLLVKDNQYIEPYSFFATLEFLPTSFGKIYKLKEKKQTIEKCLFIITPKNYKTIFSENKITFNKNFITAGSFLSKNLITLNCGIVDNCLINNKLILHFIKPFLFSGKTIIFFNNNDFIKKNESLGILFCKQTQTGDIVQGLPKVEEILEARKPKSFINDEPTLFLNLFETLLSEEKDYQKVTNKKKETSKKIKIKNANSESQDNLIDLDLLKKNESFINFSDVITFYTANPHNRLKYLNYCYKNFLNDYESAYRSLRKIQSFILTSIQKVYFSQGVQIADKHLEIIIRKMTSKVKVDYQIHSILLSGESVELRQIYNINKVLLRTNSEKLIYEPILLGITKASLTSQSFISASSFQQTIKVLSVAAIQGKVDWLRGLKENVIIGRLIPAGTGFNSYDQISYINELL
uniref:RNA polymerase beta'' subunit n=1 Tax=Merotricha bacillata TaxID=658122 RepID=UPI0021155F31|nr:RNA polymerase beta'' subunit [Merotricha bacillata]UTE94531.1 RNA polymerase beta'' subunit [Merotricha bacillata]